MVNKCILLIEKHPLFPTKSSFIKQMNLCIHPFSTLWVKFFTQFETWQVLSMKYGCEAVEIWNGIMHKREKSGWITFGNENWWKDEFCSLKLFIICCMTKHWCLPRYLPNKMVQSCEVHAVQRQKGKNLSLCSVKNLFFLKISLLLFNFI